MEKKTKRFTKMAKKFIKMAKKFMTNTIKNPYVMDIKNKRNKCKKAIKES